MKTEAPVLEFRDVGMRFGTTQALEGVSFSQSEGSLLCLLGPSGAGKTTLLRLAGGLLLPSRGEVLLKGAPARERWGSVAYVFQEPRLAPWRTAQENVEMTLQLRQPALTGAERGERARAGLARVELLAEVERYPAQLSGGQAQRVALARALAVEPRVLLMDEPFGALDPGTRERLRAMLLRLHQETGKTILFVTHDVEEALLLGDELLVLSPRPGRIIERLRLEQPQPRRLAGNGRLRELEAQLRAGFHQAEVGA